jgi:hypothetical protein
MAMLMGVKNAPAIHQWHMITALCKFLGKFCHVYLDDILIWSNNVAKHTQHIDLVMIPLKEASLF